MSTLPPARYAEVLDFLYTSLPMYQREGAAAYKADLLTTRELDEYFSHPHRKYPVIHIAGTNGKGSVSHLLAAVLQKAGYRTGLYTSPHLLDFRERIRVNGQPIPKSEVVDFVDQNRQIIRKLEPSFFEMTVAMALEHFARQKVDVAVVETGMGGRLDSTNIVDPLVSIITNISLDHMRFLGNDLSSIAREKGGIIKKGRPLVLGTMPKEASGVLSQMAGEKGAGLREAEAHFVFAYKMMTKEGSALFSFTDSKGGRQEQYGCGLTGSYQSENLATALTALQWMQEMGWNLEQHHIKAGLEQVVELTGIRGRWETVGANPRSICDTGHNPAGVAAIVTQLEQIPHRNLHMVWGMVNDKDATAILRLLPRNAHYYFTPSSVPRSMDPKALVSLAMAHGLQGSAHESVKAAYTAAREAAATEDLVFTGGSTFVVADLLESLSY